VKRRAASIGVPQSSSRLQHCFGKKNGFTDEGVKREKKKIKKISLFQLYADFIEKATCNITF